MKQPFPFPPLLLIALMFTGCGETIQVKDYDNTLKHMIALQGDGTSYRLEPKNEVADEAPSPIVDMKEHVDFLVSKIPQKSRILIYIHGGLNGIRGSVEKVNELVKEVDNEGGRNDDFPYYPIVINWESSIHEAYFDHLYRIRQGKESPIFGKVTAPFYFLADVGRALFRYPITLGFQFYRGINPIPVSDGSDLNKFNTKLFDPRPNPDQILLGRNRIEPFTWPWFSDRLTYVFPGILKIITTPVLDAFGKAGWENMVRRTQTALRTPEEFETEALTVAEVQNITRLKDPSLKPVLEREKSKPTGGLSVLMERLRLLKKMHGSQDYKVTLIGHSMGTLMLNEVLRLYGDSEKDFEYDEIVYMAAACTIRDFEASVVPYLQRHKNSQFFNLTLHPEADARERAAFDLLPRGSLLEWVDDYATNPPSFMELTLGKWNNAIMAFHVIPETIRPRVILKGFGIRDPDFNNGRKSHRPEAHGDFNDVTQLFWQPRYWRAP